MSDIKRITPDMINANIIGEHYFSALDGVVGTCDGGDHTDQSKGNNGGLNLMTFCVLTLRNGFMATGVSACADPASYDAAIGRKVARQNAVNECWPVMGYALRTRHNGTDALDQGAAA